MKSRSTDRFLQTRYDQAGILVGEGAGKYKKFEDLSRRIKKFLNLKSVKIDGMGRAVKWVAK